MLPGFTDVCWQITSYASPISEHGYPQRHESNSDHLYHRLPRPVRSIHQLSRTRLRRMIVLIFLCLLALSPYILASFPHHTTHTSQILCIAHCLAHLSSRQNVLYLSLHSMCLSCPLVGVVLLALLMIILCVLVCFPCWDLRPPGLATHVRHSVEYSMQGHDSRWVAGVRMCSYTLDPRVTDHDRFEDTMAPSER